MAQRMFTAVVVVCVWSPLVSIVRSVTPVKHLTTPVLTIQNQKVKTIISVLLMLALKLYFTEIEINHSKWDIN